MQLLIWLVRGGFSRNSRLSVIIRSCSYYCGDCSLAALVSKNTLVGSCGPLSCTLHLFEDVDFCCANLYKVCTCLSQVLGFV